MFLELSTVFGRRACWNDGLKNTFTLEWCDTPGIWGMNFTRRESPSDLLKRRRASVCTWQRKNHTWMGFYSWRIDRLVQNPVCGCVLCPQNSPLIACLPMFAIFSCLIPQFHIVYISLPLLNLIWMEKTYSLPVRRSFFIACYPFQLLRRSQVSSVKNSHWLIVLGVSSISHIF